MQIHDVHQQIDRSQRRKGKKRVGRGPGSGHGKMSSKGHKGHSSRQGYKQNPLMEGGGQPIIRRVPKRGFNNGPFRKTYLILNLDILNDTFAPNDTVDEALLRRVGLLKGQRRDGVKILGDGALTKPLVISATKFSKSAADKITAAGGRAIVVA